MINVGLVGYGPAGAFFHGPLIAATPGLRLDAVVTRDPERSALVRRDHPGARVVSSAEELVGLGPDLVVIASPNRTHVPFATLALSAGLPVVVDKPLAGTAAEALELVRLAGERGVMLTVFQNRRWDGDYRTLCELTLGRVHRFESRFERWRPVPKGGWRETGGPEELGGVLYDLGSHLVDQALQYLGPVTDVYAEADVRRAGAGDDDAFVALTHANGARSHLWMSAVAGQLGPRFRVLGSEAAYVKWGLDPQEERLRAGERPDGRPEWGAEPAERWGVLGVEGRSRPVETVPGAYLDFYTGVAACLRDGAPPPVDPSGVADALAVLHAAHTSAAERRVISLEPPLTPTAA
ncbi:Gfo/Idh/MocA family oxidoreductase [Sphaerisporangium sp. TRM90804]|uniref:Gfo/Idh/MocA family protein n=1 Tax=Sphaerisporangium sp. TRM90804 TaxID=3031113 RepID=UPI00244A97D4|nr:Gfo/Idh/MocA family oxidoreductase [Sphaerisporangium sp. TRM90804]MDH2424384.1 Gfo/Idh/MocA family oxidoreductase [Sphaerisporangium sp. TRM90804]